MKIYHVETQEAYDELMIELEEKGYKWLSGCEPTSKNYWKSYNKNICIVISDKYITFGLFEQIKKQHQNTPIIEYKAKGENMTQEEMKRKLQKNAFDVYISVETVAARGISKAEADLQEAKSSAKNLIEKIDECLETLKPKFQVGDYVVEQNGDVISKIGEVINGDFRGTYYKKSINFFGNLGAFIRDKDIERYATPEEIAEYESALQFHKHGREPFEVKKGDLVKLPSGSKEVVAYPETLFKSDFTKNGRKLLATAEEVNEWLENKLTQIIKLIF